MKKLLIILVSCSLGLWIGREISHTVEASSIVQQAYNLVQNAGTPLTRRTTINCTGSLTCSDSGTVTTFNVTGGGTGGLTLVEQHTASTSAELDFTTCISSTYDDYQIEVVGILVSNNAANLTLQVHIATGYDTGSNYNTAIGTWTASSGFAGTGGNAQTSILLFHVIGTTANWTTNGTVMLHNIASAFPMLTAHMAGRNNVNNALQEDIGTSMYITTTAVDGFRILPSAGTLTSGTVRCYGLSK